MTYFEMITLSIIEGLTEFLPISSTGHMIIASQAMGLTETDFLKAFQVIIQFGAILSVMWLYLRKLKEKPELLKWMIIGFLPAAFFGFLLKDIVDSIMTPVVVAISLIVGGVVLIQIDHWLSKVKNAPTRTLSQLNIKDALYIGVWQCLALVPGVSRSGATIVGGLFHGYEKKEVVEFSFLLALPTIGAATLYKLLKIYKLIDSSQVNLLVFGTIISFFVALLAIQFFISIVSNYGFKYFGFYRIILGAVVLILNFK